MEDPVILQFIAGLGLFGILACVIAWKINWTLSNNVLSWLKDLEGLSLDNRKDIVYLADRFDSLESVHKALEFAKKFENVHDASERLKAYREVNTVMIDDSEISSESLADSPEAKDKKSIFSKPKSRRQGGSKILGTG